MVHPEALPRAGGLAVPGALGGGKRIDDDHIKGKAVPHEAFLGKSAQRGGLSRGADDGDRLRAEGGIKLWVGSAFWVHAWSGFNSRTRFGQKAARQTAILYQSGIMTCPRSVPEVNFGWRVLSCTSNNRNNLPPDGIRANSQGAQPHEPRIIECW